MVIKKSNSKLGIWLYMILGRLFLNSFGEPQFERGKEIENLFLVGEGELVVGSGERGDEGLNMGMEVGDEIVAICELVAEGGGFGLDRGRRRGWRGRWR
ncbi:unnamed protein product [Linum trigynum]|uniref:Cyclic nucleotide-binding domain-containing protein n=1 Tax=Linum trigynum TaxID=586398 RepID=A0AAV2E2U6_9ROSI